MPELKGAQGRRVTLPLASSLDAVTVRRQFGVSRTTLMRWRRQRDFPKADASGNIEAAAIQAFAKRAGFTIDWV